MEMKVNVSVEKEIIPYYTVTCMPVEITKHMPTKKTFGHPPSLEEIAQALFDSGDAYAYATVTTNYRFANQGSK